MVREGNTPALAAAALSVLPSELAAFREADPNFERELIAVLAQRQIELHRVHRTGTRDERAAALAELERSHGWIKPGRVAWSWWSDTSSPGNLQRQRAFVRAAAAYRWEYVLLDAGWNGRDVPGLAGRPTIQAVLDEAKPKAICIDPVQFAKHVGVEDSLRLPSLVFSTEEANASEAEMS